MSGLNPDGLGQSERFRNTEHESLGSGSITDKSDGQAWETLREIGYESGDVLPLVSLSSHEKESAFTSTSFTEITYWQGSVFDLSTVPNPVHVRLISALQNDTAGETTTIQPVLSASNSAPVEITEASVAKTGTGYDIADSNWVELTSVSLDDAYQLRRITGKVSGGTGKANSFTFLIGVEI